MDLLFPVQAAVPCSFETRRHAVARRCNTHPCYACPSRLQAISDSIFASFVAAEVDKVELVFTKFISLITAEPSIQVCLMHAMPRW